MPHNLTEPQWVDRFLNKLGQLVHNFSIKDAMQAALATYPDASDMEPEEAAEVFALECPPGECGAPVTAALEQKTPVALWAEAFADRWTELADGAADYHEVLGIAYVVYSANRSRPAAEVADEEWKATLAKR